MPIYIRENKENQAKPGSLLSEIPRLKRLIVTMQQQMTKMASTIKRLKGEKHKLEIDLARRDTEIKRVKHELSRITRGRNNVERDFGDL